MPSMSGILGSDSPPAPEITVRADQVPADVDTVHRWASSSHTASSTAVSKTKRSSVPDAAATFWM